MNKLVKKAYAKVSLALDVIRKREDGYHEVRMIMQTIHLYDRLQLHKTKESGVQLKSNLSFSIPSSVKIPEICIMESLTTLTPVVSTSTNSVVINFTPY